MNGFSWDGIRVFIVAAEEGSLTGAARRLGSNQPTVGRHIDALETQLGVKLFQRSVKGLNLTEEGVRLLEQSQPLARQMATLAMAADSGGSLRGVVRLALPEGLALEVITPALRRFHHDYPGLQLELAVSASAANLTRGEADVAIRLFRPHEARVVSRRLGVMEMGLYASQGYLAEHTRPKDEAELAGHRIICYGERLASLAENRWLLERCAPSVPLLSSDSTATRLRATVEGLGLSIQPTLLCRHHPGLERLLPELELPAHEVWLVYHEELRQVPRVRAVAGFLADTVKACFVG